MGFDPKKGQDDSVCDHVHPAVWPSKYSAGFIFLIPVEPGSKMYV
jgi:hypothetical protein